MRTFEYIFYFVLYEVHYLTLGFLYKTTKIHNLRSIIKNVTWERQDEMGIQ